jgi:hypothetical protein
MTQPYDGQDRRMPLPAQDPGWHLDRKVPLTLIFAMLMQAAMVIWAIADIKKDVEILKSQYIVQSERDNKQDLNAKEVISLLREQLKEMTGKLDRLIERNNR